MPNLITSGERAIYESARDDIFLTFAQELVAWKLPQKTIISTDINYQYSYNGPDGIDDENYVEYTPESISFSGCILFNNSLEKFYSNPQGSRAENFRIVMDAGTMRLKVKRETWEFLKDSPSIEFDNYRFTIQKTERPHGIFSPKYYTLYLQFQN